LMQYITHINEILCNEENIHSPEIENLKNYGLYWVEYWYENDHMFEDSLSIDLSRFEHLKTCNISYIYINNIVSIPSKLEYISIQYCELYHIGDLPKNITYFNCNSNNIKVLPNMKDTKIQNLYCSSNQLRQLPPLPNTVEYLFCYQNKIRFLPKLPKNLEYLSCNSNRLYAVVIIIYNIYRKFYHVLSNYCIVITIIYLDYPIFRHYYAHWFAIKIL